MKLPKVIKVKIHLDEDGYVAELVQYNTHTQASTKEELDEMINDLIYGYFDIPKKLQSSIRYVARQEKKIEEVHTVKALVEPGFFNQFSFA